MGGRKLQMAQDEDRVPVLIGVGQVNDRPVSGAEGHGGAGLLARVDWLGVVNQISFPEYDGRLTGLVSQALGISPRYAHETKEPTGDSPILLINQAANAIGRGACQVAL